MKQQSGFTLIELIIVIVILGILAATALPKFADLKDDANRAALKGVAGAMGSAAVIAHAAQLAAGAQSSTAVTLEGTQVTMVNGYPEASASGIGAALTSNDFVWQASGVGKTGTANGTCYMSYANSNNGAMPVIGAASAVSGC